MAQYHATPIKNLNSIHTHGLRPKNNQIFLSPTIEDALYAASQWYHDSEFAVLSVNINDMAFDGVESDGRDNTVLISNKIIPPNRIKYIGTRKRM